MSPKWCIVIFGAICLGMTAPSAAQEPGPTTRQPQPEQGMPVAGAPTAPKPTEEELVQLTFPENLEVKVLIDYVSLRLGINVLYDDAIVHQKVTISSPTKIPKSSLPGLLESVLKMSGLSIVDSEQKGWKRVVKSQDLYGTVEGFRTDPSKVDAIPATTVVAQVFQLQHVTTAAVEPLVKPFLSKPGGSMFSIPERNMVFVTDYGNELRRIAKLIEMTDKPGGKSVVRFVPVKYLDASALSRQVTGLLQDQGKVSGQSAKYVKQGLLLAAEPRTNQIIIIAEADGAEAEAMDLIKGLDVPTGDATQVYRLQHISPQRIDKLARSFFDDDLTKRRYKSTIDAEGGLLIVSGPAAVHEQISSLIRDLDVGEASAETGSVRFYKLLNSTAADVLTTIRSIESGGKAIPAMVQEGAAAVQQQQTPEFTGPNNPPPEPGKELPTPPAYKPPAKEGEPKPAAASTADARSLSVKTKDAVVTADPATNTIIVVAPPDVQAVYKQLITMLDRRRPQVMVQVTVVTLDTSNGFSLGVELSRPDEDGTSSTSLVFSALGLSTVNAATGKLAMIPGAGLNATLVRPDQIDVVIKALASSGRAKVLSSPKLLVNDHASATISSVAEAPFTSVNASNTVSTTSFAGYASAGTQVTVTPHISEGDHLQLKYSITLSSFTGTGSSGVPPPRQTNTVNSEVTIPDGYSVVTGGMSREDTSETVAKVPILGDIPLAGALFRSKNKQSSQSTMFVFIRPVVLRDTRFEDLKYLSERDLKTAGMPAGLPKSRPLIMQ